MCCINNAVHTWALHLRGPVYVAMFKPLSIAIAAAMGVVILGDTLYLGRYKVTPKTTPLPLKHCISKSRMFFFFTRLVLS